MPSAIVCRATALSVLALVVATSLSASGAPAPGPLPDMASVAQVVGAPAGWSSGADGHGVDVALIDTGVTPVAGLNGSGKLIYGPDLSFDSQDPSTTHLDGYGHGTALAGIIAGNDGGSGGYTGVAPAARLVSVKVGATSGAVDVTQIIAGIDWVTQHAHDPGLNIRVINLSLGTNSVQSYQVDPLAHAAEAAWRHGIVVVVAAGNDGTATNAVADPATHPLLVAVGAADPQGTVATTDDTVASFSQRGTGSRHADLVAPGVSLYGLLSPGSTLATQNPAAVYGDRYLRGSGTSQAAAVVTGVVADLLSVRPSLTPDQVKAALTSSATRIASSNPNFVGAGLVQLPGALSAQVSSSAQPFPAATGSGSLEKARQDNHVSFGGVALTGEKDIFGKAWDTSAMASAERSASAWSDGVYNGSSWSGSSWSGSSWSGSSWSGSSWSGSSWSGSSWSGSSWSGSSWSGSSWSGSSWSGSTWSSSSWLGASWLGASWD